MTRATPFEASVLRVGKPDFLDLPWHLSLLTWEGVCERLEKVPQGDGRHPVLFVNYDGVLYGIKEMPPGIAEREYEALTAMEELRLPVVQAAGHLKTRTDDGPQSILITRFLDRALPYQTLFSSSDFHPYHEPLLDAMAGLLVQLHLAGVFWGDCSLANTLFRRDAGTLQAYLVDAETAELHDAVSDGMRAHDLDIMEENVAGSLGDLAAQRGLDPLEAIGEISGDIRRRYETLWVEITREEVIGAQEGWRLQNRIRALNDLGFSVREVSLVEDKGGERLRLRAQVADRHYHRDLLHSLTGIDTGEQQARLLVNEIQEHRLRLSEQHSRSVPLSAAAFHWQLEVYGPAVRRLQTVSGETHQATDLYCQMLEHKWYLSERAGKDVGHETATADFLRQLSTSTFDNDGLQSEDF